MTASGTCDEREELTDEVYRLNKEINDIQQDSQSGIAL